MNKLVGEFPKIGIRAIIDGRRNGVREALEENTKKLASNVAKLIEDNLTYINGEKVKVVISKTTIGGVKEAAETSEYFKSENVGAIIDVTYAWAYASELMEHDTRIPKAIWGFNGTQRPGSVYLAGAIAACEQKGYPIFKIYSNDIQEIDDTSIPEDVAQKILQFSKCAIALGTMKGKSYLSMGSVSMGIGGSIINSDLFEEYFGMHNEYIDMSEFIRRIELKIYDEEEYNEALAWVKNNCLEMKDPNKEEIQQNRQKKDEVWETVIKMTLIARDLMIGNNKLKEKGFIEEADGHNAIVGGFQGQRQWTDYYPNGDFMEAILNSSFDWNGQRTPYIVATENDSLNGMSMLLGYLLTGTSQIFADVRTYWSPNSIKKLTGHEAENSYKDGFIYLTNSGSAALDGTGRMKEKEKNVIKPFWKVTKEDMENCLKYTKWGAGKLVSFRGGGYSSSYKTVGGLPLTMVRLNLVKNLGPVLQLAEGYSIELDEEVENKIIERTDPTWPKTFFVPKLTGKGAFTSVYSVMNSWGSNHCSLCYGHVGSDIITLASMLRIPVMMHNIAEEKIFRPATWNSFGTEWLESADFRACKEYGALYKK